jgi:hypothetical protein
VRGTSAMTSVSTVEHLADSASGPSGCPSNREIPDSKVQSPRTLLHALPFFSPPSFHTISLSLAFTSA